MGVTPELGWSVSVNVGGETVLTIAHNFLSGADNIEEYRETIINCAKHLLALVGENELAVNADAPSSFVQKASALHLELEPNGKER